jgi:hypothetical protein
VVLFRITDAMTRRPWTAQDQITAEVAAACGLNYMQIGRVLKRAGNVVKNRLHPAAAGKHREGSRRWRDANIDRARENSRRYHKANADKLRESSRIYYAANRSNCLESKRRYYSANIEKCREKCHLYRKANRSKLLEKQRRYYIENIEMCRESARHRYWANIEKHRERNRLYREASREQRRESCRRYYKANAERLRAKARLYREANLHKVNRYRRVNREIQNLRSRQYRNANIERCRENTRRWMLANPEKCRENARRRAAVKRASRHRALLPATRTAIDARFAIWGNHCAFCGVDAKHPRNASHKRLTVEHVLALTKGGLDEASNIIPACLTCNSSKQTRPVEEWYRRQPFYTDARWRKIQRHCPGAHAGQLPLAIRPDEQP